MTLELVILQASYIALLKPILKEKGLKRLILLVKGIKQDKLQLGQTLFFSRYSEAYLGLP